MLNPFIFKILQYNENNHVIENQDKILVSVSAGVDSCCLLHFLQTISTTKKLQLAVIHFNHNTRHSNNADAILVNNICQQYDIPFIIKSKSFTKKDFQLYARKWRLEEAKNELEKIKFNKLALGHQKNDVAETIFWKLSRGASVFSLHSLSTVRANIIRPLIDTYKIDIEYYMNENRISYLIDPTNNENDYTRNKIRNNILPYIANQLEPAFIAKLCQLNQSAQELNEYILEQIKNFNLDTNFIEIQQFKGLPKLIVKQVISRWLLNNQQEFNNSQLQMIIDNLWLQNKTIQLPQKTIRVAGGIIQLVIKTI